MSLILLICLKLSILHLCVCDLGYYCEGDPWKQNEIFLIQVNNTQNHLNKKFIEKCSNFFRIFTISEIFSNISSFRSLSEGLTFINLHVNDYAEHSNNPLQENLLYAGHLIIPEININVTTNKTATKYDNADRIVKLMSKSEITNETYAFVDSIQVIDDEIYSKESCISVIEKAEDIKTVLLCLDSETYEGLFEANVNINIKPLKLRIKSIDYCQSNINTLYNFVAVLTPKPFEIDFENSVPIVFYETSYILPKFESIFPNSISLQKWQLLKHVFLEFLSLLEWQRVVIVSDASFYSIDFENELTSLFQENYITYTVIRCEKTCDEEAINFLRTARARIVIANIEENNAKFLIQNAYSKIVWLLRDKNEAIGQVISSKDVFTFSLGASEEQGIDCYFNKNILGGISSISKAYKYMMKNELNNLSKLELYRELSMLIKQMKRPDSMAYVNKLKNGKSLLVSVMHVNDRGATVISFDNPFKDRDLPKDLNGCLFRSYDYSKPCEEFYVLLIMFVLLLFTTTTLLITCYFHKSSPYHDITYQKF